MRRNRIWKQQSITKKTDEILKNINTFIIFKNLRKYILVFPFFKKFPIQVKEKNFRVFIRCEIHIKCLIFGFKVVLIILIHLQYAEFFIIEDICYNKHKF